MKRYICIHGHFYQPPRENPWLEAIERQDSAHPYHDWNERITAECYAPNAASRILDESGTISAIVNNYSHISFNFGPTLLSWLQDRHPDTYAAILQADRDSQSRFNGHGAAIAQAYNHIILPLANARDKRTQIEWGVRDFEDRFQRAPEGLWLAETAVDTETLELLVEFNIRYTLLAPRQAKSERLLDSDQWHDVSGGRIDPRRPYLCKLPSGAQIVLFFYDGGISQDIAFSGLLSSGESLANRLAAAFPETWPQDCLVHVSTDGETYGHHARFGDMALAYCLHHIQKHQVAELTIYGAFLDDHPPRHEVVIHENSSWSCIHGVERWRSNCGCSSGGRPGWHQRWREPLRASFNFLRDAAAPVFEELAAPLVRDPWLARDRYISVVLDRSPEKFERFVQEHAARPLNPRERTQLIKLMEMQRHAMLMFTSCGWFFDEISGIESVQTIQYAARALQLLKEVSGRDLEEAFIEQLRLAPSNIAEFGHGANVYARFVKPAKIDLLRVAVHYAMTSLFREIHSVDEVYCYHAESRHHDVFDHGRLKLVIGSATLSSKITFEESSVSYAALHFGDHNIICGVRHYLGDEAFWTMHEDIKRAFQKANLPDTIRAIDRQFANQTHDLSHLFRDEQLEVFRELVGRTLDDIEGAGRRIYASHHALMSVVRDFHLPTPRVFDAILYFLITTDFRRVFEAERPDLDELQRVVELVDRWGYPTEDESLVPLIQTRVHLIVVDFAQKPDDLAFLQYCRQLLGLVRRIGLKLDLGQAQNSYYFVLRHPDLAPPRPNAALWHDELAALGRLLGVRGNR